MENTLIYDHFHDSGKKNERKEKKWNGGFFQILHFMNIYAF